MPFCGKLRKRKSQKNEPLQVCLTIDGCKTIINAAKRNCDARTLGLGESIYHSFLCTNGWCDLIERYLFVCVFFLYTFVVRLPSA